MSLLIKGATVIDGVATTPIPGKSIWVDRGRIRAVDREGDLGVPADAEVIDAKGKYVIPGLMDANVHLLIDTRLENLARHEGRYEDLITEAAQVALRSGVTTVFDSWGPRRPLMAVRDRINAGELLGSRIFCAGNIVGLDGPLSVDFWPKTTEVASSALIDRINDLWVENVGPSLTWMTPDKIAQEIRAYIGNGIDFLKFAASEHRLDPTTFLQFSPLAQSRMVEEAHSAGITAQAHIMSVEALRVAIEAGCDLIQHGNITGPTPIPHATLELFVKRRTACAILSWTKRRQNWLMTNASSAVRRLMSTSSQNVENLVRAGVTLVLSTDGGVMARESRTDPKVREVALWSEDAEENLGQLGEGHIFWFSAMEESGMSAMDMLKAATSNIAMAYKKDKDLGTLEASKVADLIVLDKDPLQNATNYRSIHMILKDGNIVQREKLPLNRILTRECSTTDISESRRFAGAARLPLCC